MFGRVQSGIFGNRRRVAPAPQEAPRPFPLPLGPPRARVSDADFPLPFEDADANDIFEPGYVPLYHMRNRTLAEQRAQARRNVEAAAAAFPPKNVVVQAPGGELFSAGQIPSREQESAQRQSDALSRARFMARGGVIKSYGIGSSSLKEMGRAVRDPNLKLNEFVKVAKTGQPLEVVRGQNAEVEARQPSRPRPRQVGPRR